MFIAPFRKRFVGFFSRRNAVSAETIRDGLLPVVDKGDDGAY